MRLSIDSRSITTLGGCLLVLSSCSGSSGSGSSASASNPASLFTVESISVANNSVVPLNRRIVIGFSQEVNFALLSSSSIQVATANGTTATGRLEPLMLDTTGDGIGDTPDLTQVVWQPACPILPDNSDSGLRGGTASVGYTLRIRGTDSGAPFVVTSMSGRALVRTETRSFSTPASTNPSILFEDVVPGAPLVRARAIGGTTQSGVSYVELGGDSDPDTRLFFERDDAAQMSIVVPGPAVTGGSDVPLNLFADPKAQVAFVVEFNQPVNTSVVNISDNRIRVEYLLPAPGSLWTPIETDVLLLQNCSLSGARVRLEPQGILPASSQVRVNVLPGFQGLTGLFDSTTTAQSLFAVVDTRDLDFSTLANPGTGADEIFEDFTFGGAGRNSRQDVQANLITPSADWSAGRLSSTLNFAGSGGENGEFDWVIKQNPELFDTSQQTIQGGPNGEIKYEQFTVGGLVNVRNFIIERDALLLVRGPNPFVLNATGEIRIEGTLDISGNGARDVATLNTGSQPEPGGSGNCGGGDGGTASEVRSSSTPRGGTGFSPFGNGKDGGIGGEFGFPRPGASPGLAPDSRRPGGGGGGRFAADQDDTTATGVGSIPSFGMLAGPGAQGNIDARSAFNPDGRPQGGGPGIGPFIDGNPTNDFFGRRADTQVAILMNGSAPVLQSVGGIITGELTGFHAGYGGGAGGDAGTGSRFPTPNWSVSSDEKGAGGGGAGGAIRLRALGPIRFVGNKSQLLCLGGRGATGENSIFVDRIGGSGGSGSGGHVILDSATGVFFELPPVVDRPSGQRRRTFVDARGAQGRIGAPTNGNGLTLPPDDSHGGHGGPGVIQIHVPNATAPPHENSNLSDIVLPVGTIVELNAGDENALLEVMRPAGIQMLPEFGVLSSAQSRWIDLRRGELNPDGSENLLSFLFKGINPSTGLVLTSAGRVSELAPILTGTLNAATGTFVGSNGLTFSTLALQPLIASTDPISNDLYLRTPALLRNFTLRMTPPIGVFLDFSIQDADFDQASQSLNVIVAPSAGVNLSAFDVPGSEPTFQLIPRFFGISRDGVRDALPDGSTVRFSFEGATEDANGDPDTSSLLVEETSDFDDFQMVGLGELDFIRFKVEFNIDTLGSGVGIDTPALNLEFLRLPFIY